MAINNTMTFHLYIFDFGVVTRCRCRCRCCWGGERRSEARNFVRAKRNGHLEIIQRDFYFIEVTRFKLYSISEAPIGI